MKRCALIPAVLILLALLTGCGGGKKAATTVTVAITPTSASLAAGQTQQFTASVTNATNTAVNWQVNGIVGGTTSTGTISTAGLYTAPATIASTTTVTISAVSQADTTQSAQAPVTLTAPSIPPVILTVSPSSVTLPAGSQQTFTATENGVSVTVIWSVNCQSPATGACGTISSAGVYTAPLSPPSPGAGGVTVKATTTDNSAAPASAAVAIQFSNATLKGQYAFSFSGTNAGVPYVSGGSITFDGNGSITGGVLDTNSGPFTSAPITGGTYHVGLDGRGNAAVQTGAGAIDWQFALVNHSRALAVRFDAGITGSGALDLQDTTQFNIAAIAGPFTFSLASINAAQPAASVAVAGALTADGTGVITGGFADSNSGGSAAAGALAPSAYTAPSATSGRGTLTLSSGQTFAYYIQDATRLKLVQIDPGHLLRGDLVSQPVGPFSLASFVGSFAFTFSGSASGGALGEGGVFSPDGSGNFSSGTVDVNNDGNLQLASPLAGTYTVADAATGRTTVTWNVGGSTLTFVGYPRKDLGWNFVETTASRVTAGTALVQTGSFTSGSVQGNYAARFTGTDFISAHGQEDISGRLAPNGGSAVAGTLDINDAGALSTAAGLLSSSYQVGSNGRGTGTLGTTASAFASSNVSLYVVDANTVLFLETDGSRMLTGIMQKQY